VLVHEPKKNFYRKFLYEPFPVESQLLKMETVLYNQLNAEVAGGSVRSKGDAVNFLTWTFMWRRLVQNPSFYGLENTTDEGVADFLLSLVEKSFDALHSADCAVVDGDDIVPTSLGQITSRYYISYLTGYLFQTRDSTATTLEDCVRDLSDAPEFDDVPVRHNEDELNAELAKFCPWKVDSFAFDDPHVKAFLLLQAKHMGIRLPIQDFVTDTTSVMAQIPRLCGAFVAVVRLTKSEIDPAILKELEEMYSGNNQRNARGGRGGGGGGGGRMNGRRGRNGGNAGNGGKKPGKSRQ
jgi:activating signal cointegrator complex subunit 3